MTHLQFLDGEDNLQIGKVLALYRGGGVIISPQLLYRRKETWYQEYKRLGGPQG
jgi:hypothetical protein